MISFRKIFATAAVASTILAAGSAVALLSPGTDNPGVRKSIAIPFVQGFSADGGWTCATSGTPVNAALTFQDRWDGQWVPASNDFTRFAWASCSNSWAYDYLNDSTGPPSTVASARPINLSTLPLMR